MWIPEWNVPHSEHRTVPFLSKQPQLGHDAKAAYTSNGSLSIQSLHEHVFLVACDDVAGFVFFDGHRFIFVIKLNNGAKDFLILKR